jgi:hypothetical protein
MMCMPHIRDLTEQVTGVRYHEGQRYSFYLPQKL